MYILLFSPFFKNEIVLFFITSSLYSFELLLFFGRFFIFKYSSSLLSLIFLISVRYSSSVSSISSTSSSEAINLSYSVYESISSSSDKYLKSSPNVSWKACILFRIFSFNDKCSSVSVVGKILKTCILSYFVPTLFIRPILCITLVGFHGKS